MAGGGVKGGLAYGETDDFGYQVAEGRVTSPTITPRCCTCWGWITSADVSPRTRDEKLTDVHEPNIVKGILA